MQFFPVKSVVFETSKVKTVWYSGLDKIQKMDYGPVMFVTSNNLSGLNLFMWEMKKLLQYLFVL